MRKAAAAAIPEKPSATSYDVIKRILDVICSVLALAVFMPALLKIIDVLPYKYIKIFFVKDH